MIRFRLKLQYATSEPDQHDDRGSVDQEAVPAALASFDWRGQVESANQLEKSSPTLSVESLDGENQIWISGYGDPSAPGSVCDYAPPPEEKRIPFGLFTRKIFRGASAQDLSLEEATQAVRHFLEG